MVPDGGPTQDIDKEEVSLVGHHKKVIQVFRSEMFCTSRSARVTAFAFEEALTRSCEAALTPRRRRTCSGEAGAVHSLNCIPFEPKILNQVRWNPIAANVLATVSYDNTIKIWDIEQNGAEKHSFDDHNDAIQSFDWSLILLAATCLSARPAAAAAAAAACPAAAAVSERPETSFLSSLVGALLVPAAAQQRKK